MSKQLTLPLPTVLSHDHYTVEDWLNLPEIRGPRIELIDGSFVVSAPQSSWHQLSAGRLTTLLLKAAPPEFEVIAAFGVRTETEVAVPDGVVFDADAVSGNVAVLSPGQAHLVVEIVSPGGPRRDYHDKPRIYAEAGVPTFVRVELTGTAAPYVEVLHLRDGAYTQVAKVGAGETLELTQPFPVAFDPVRLLRRTGPPGGAGGS